MSAPFRSNCSVCHDVGVYYGYGEGGERYMYRCSEEDCPAYIRSCQEEDEAIADRQARSTLQLLSRFAVFMWMEASYAEWLEEFEGKPPFNQNCLRSFALYLAVTDGLLRVTWSQP